MPRTRLGPHSCPFWPACRDDRASIFSKLEVVPARDDHRRFLAVLAYLRK